MLLPRKWALGLGLLAAAPTLASAGPFDFLKPKTAERSAASAPTATESPRGNQEVAEDIANALKGARLVHKNVQIEYDKGVATIAGEIKDAAQRALVTRIVSQVPGVETVNNSLTLMDVAPARPAAPQVAAKPAPEKAAAPTPAPKPSPVNQAAFAGSPQQPVQQVSFAEPTTSAPSNQQVAQNIADALTEVGLNGYDIEIRYKNGIASLVGRVDDAEQAARAEQATSRVPGVHQVLNRLNAPAGSPQIRPTGAYAQAMPQQQYAPRLPQQYPQGAPQAAPAGYQGRPQPGYGIQPTQAMMGQPQMMSPGAPPAAGMGYPAPGGVQPAGHHMIYNQPQVPEYAWPSYAQYDNYAAVSYPGSYDASAFPYIGPFYPYPQVPMGWREAQLVWDDGYWNLKFDSRTDRWWWFLNPHNWH